MLPHYHGWRGFRRWLFLAIYRRNYLTTLPSSDAKLSAVEKETQQPLTTLFGSIILPRTKAVFRSALIRALWRCFCLPIFLIISYLRRTRLRLHLPRAYNSLTEVVQSVYGFSEGEVGFRLSRYWPRCNGGRSLMHRYTGLGTLNA